MNKRAQPIINKQYLLEKYSGKGGWTFVRIDKGDDLHVGRSVKVKGTIDSFVISQFHLMPDGQGGLFLAVRAEIRKHINKKAGDWVQLTLYLDTDPIVVPEELQMCLDDEPVAMKFFQSLSESEQKYYIQWIVAAKREETKVARLTKTINRLRQSMKMYDQDLRRS